MAEASAKFLLNKIDNFVSKELRLRGSIKERMNELKSERKMITQVLKGADALTEQDNQIRVWIKLLRNIDYEIENAVDMHAYTNAQSKNVPCIGGLPRKSHHSINNKIQEIQTKLQGIKRMKTEYLNSLRPSIRGSNSSVDEAEIAPLNTPEKEIVGVEGPRKELVSWVNDAKQAHRVMFVVGMGGSGKTALVKLVYEQLKADFDCHVWLTASRYEHGKDLLSDMYSKLSNQRSWTFDHTLDDLIDMLSNYLRDKRYLIVLDNWNRRIWGYVKYAFPKCNRSRVMITTRRGDIASSSRDNSVDIYKIPPLPFGEAETLFCRRAFPETHAYPSVPAGLRGICESLLRECEGLPHGIIEMGKLLAYHQMRSESEFKILGNSLQAEFELNSGRLSSITRVLLSSYNELPYHLKCCFLYMSMFPKDHPVKRRMLIRLWMAEGFINGMNGKEPEDIGEEYLEELMERNLVQASELEFDGRPQTCRVHNLMHKIALSESEAENFCTFTHDISDEMRRLSIQDRGFNMPGKVLHHVRTFVSTSSCMRIPPGIIPSMKLLKILHLDHANVEALPSGIKELLLLKYLSLCNTRIKQIPTSTARLKLLQTLNLKQTFVTVLPESLVALEKLRHLLVSHYSIDGHEAFTILGELPSLLELQLLDAYTGNQFDFCAGAFLKLKTLEFDQMDRLQMIMIGNGALPCLQELSISLCQNLRKIPTGIASITQLKELHLRDMPPDFVNPLKKNGPLHHLVRHIKLNSRHLQHASTSGEHEAGIDPLYTPEMEIVGVDGPREELASWVLDVERAHRVMFVVGMGGSGKTALVKVVYEQLKTDFDCHVWLTASVFEKMEELLSTMYNKLCNQTGQSDHTLEDLINMLNNYLRDKRYLIVLDNWKRKNWESVKYAFPKDNSSRVIITTRRGDIASSWSENTVDIHKILPLPCEKARELFCRRAFRGSGVYPSVPGLPEASERLLKECEGLPLGIIEMGKVLSRAESCVSQFKKLENSLQDELKLNSGQLSSITQVLLLSYNDLPYHLKCCFLYMSMFHEDHPVNCRMLIRLWMAEDFISGGNQKEPEDIGEEYLKELMDRNLVLASELEFDGTPRTCRVHNLMHKIVLSKSEAENFCTVTRIDLNRKLKSNGSDISEKMQRLSIQNSEFNMSDKVLHHVHTFFSVKMQTIPRGIIPSMKLLKILHLDQVNLEALPKGIKKLLLLKYLSLRNTRIKLLPISTGRLKHLETLNLKQTFVTELPDSLVALENLRHLLVGCYSIHGHEAFDAVQGVKVPTAISRLTNLQKLSFVRADREHKLIQELRNLTKLRKLGIIDLPSDSGPYLHEMIQMLTSLRSLCMASQKMNDVLRIQEINNPPQLQRLYLWGRLQKMPQWISKLHELVRIRLKWSRLEAANNPITILGKLNNLLELQLLDAYTGNQLDFCAGTFLKLKILELDQMEQLQRIMIGNGALPCLQKLTISLCQKLKEIPAGIDCITQLKELHFRDMPPNFVNPLKGNGTLHHLAQHIKINSRHLQNGVWVQQDMS